MPSGTFLLKAWAKKNLPGQPGPASVLSTLGSTSLDAESPLQSKFHCSWGAKHLPLSLLAQVRHQVCACLVGAGACQVCAWCTRHVEKVSTGQVTASRGYCLQLTQGQTADCPVPQSHSPTHDSCQLQVGPHPS